MSDLNNKIKKAQRHLEIQKVLKQKGTVDLLELFGKKKESEGNKDE